MILNKHELHVLSKVKISLRGKIRNRTLMDYSSTDSDGTIDFNEYKNYTPGENLRHIDWNKYYTESDLYVRKFYKLEKPDFYVVPDFTSSIAASNKIDDIKRFTAAICFCLLNKAMVVKLRLPDGVYNFTGRSQVNTLMDKIANFNYKAIENKKLSTINDVYSNNVIIISDFIFSDGFEQFEKTMNVGPRSCSLFNISNINDRSPVLSGNIRLVDSQNGKTVITRISPDIINRYKSVREKYYQKVIDHCNKMNWCYREIFAEDSVDSQFEKIMPTGVLVL